MNIIFIVLALILFILIIGWPIWLLIWGLIQKKKTGKFPWIKFVIIVIIGVLITFVIRVSSLNLLQGTGNNYGINSISGDINIK